ncbi:MAG: hypothetical protein ABIC40_04235 [bacterium]
MSAVPKRNESSFRATEAAVRTGILAEFPTVGSRMIERAPERAARELTIPKIKINAEAFRRFERGISYALIAILVSAWSYTAHSTLIASTSAENLRLAVYSITDEIGRMKTQLQEKQTELGAIDGQDVDAESPAGILEGTLLIEDKDVVTVKLPPSR